MALKSTAQTPLITILTACLGFMALAPSATEVNSYALEMASRKVNLAILDFSGSKEANVSLDDKNSLTDVILGVALKRLPPSQWNILNRQYLSEQDSGKDLSDCSDKCLIEVGNVVHPDYLVSGKIRRLGSNLQVTLNLYELNDLLMGNITDSENGTVKNVEDLTDTLKKMAAGFFANLANRNPIQIKAPEKPTDGNSKEFDEKFGGVARPWDVRFGIHWAPAAFFGVESDAGKITNPDLALRILAVDQKGRTGLQGFGLKFWVGEYIETALNMQYGYYNAFLKVDNTPKPLIFDLKNPLLAKKPYFSRYTGDVAFLYPLRKLSPTSRKIKVHAGGGLSLSMATPVISTAFVENALNIPIVNDAAKPPTDATLIQIIEDAFAKEKSKVGFGGFAQAGARYKPSRRMPVAGYLDMKYHLLFSNPDLVSGSDITLELGIALAL